MSEATDTLRERAPAFREALEGRLEGEPPSRARLVFVGLLQRFLEEVGHGIVLVGGGAVELYTSGAYTTADVDLVGHTRLVAALLEPAGFERDGRYFTADDLGLLVEVPGNDLRDTEDVVEVEVGDLVVPVVSPEDVLVDRLLAAKFWESPKDRQQAVILYAAHEDRFDADALEAKAEANDVLDTLVEVRATVEEED